MTFGFSNAVIPHLKSLEKSGTFDAVESDLQMLFIELFSSHFSADFFDLNVLANPQLGSIALVRSSLDELGVSITDRLLTDTQIRVTHKSWSWTHQQKRGFFMLKTLLQIIYGEGFTIENYWHPKSTANDYPKDVFLQSITPDTSDAFLTSRVLVTIPLDGQPHLRVLRRIALSIVPARMVVFFKSLSTEQLLIYGYGAEDMERDIFIPEAFATDDILTVTYSGGGA